MRQAADGAQGALAADALSVGQTHAYIESRSVDVKSVIRRSEIVARPPLRQAKVTRLPTK
jgi:hypothetical protein